MNAPPRPSRRSLVLSSALLMAGCLSTAGSALAAPQDDLARVLACRSIPADAARLQCFDHFSTILARDARASDTSARASASAPAAERRARDGTARTAEHRDAAALDPRKTFGLSPSAILAREVKSGMRRQDISSITARVTGVGPAPDGRMIYDLDDGQVWEELVANGDAPPVSRGDKVQISRGWLDSYWLQTPSGRGCKVLRLR